MIKPDPSAFNLPALRAILAELLPSADSVCLVAYSGGMDSSVLLHGCAALRAQMPGLRLRAVHVDHGLHQESARWAGHCQQVAGRLEVPFESVRVRVVPATGESLESVARTARYAALARRLEQGECLLTAHHADDQFETVLLQLMRGAGPAGLAGMPRLRAFAAGWLARPLLGFRRAALAAWAGEVGIQWQEDPANRDPAHARNYLRQAVLPALLQRWPAASETAGRAAILCGEALRLNQALARTDLECVSRGGMPRASQLLALGEERARNALRQWITDLGLPQPARTWLQHALTDVLAARGDATPLLRWPGAELRRYRDRLWLGPELPEVPRSQVWDGREPFQLGGGFGRLSLVPVQGKGLRRRSITARPLRIAYRRGGERLRPAGAAHHRTLRNLFQEAGVPPWLRARIPLLEAGGDLAAVAGFWVSETFAARRDEAGFELRWEGQPRLG